jgi:hypothetical protein
MLFTQSPHLESSQPTFVWPSYGEGEMTQNRGISMGSVVVAPLTFFQPNLSITRAQLIFQKGSRGFLNTQLTDPLRGLRFSRSVSCHKLQWPRRAILLRLPFESFLVAAISDLPSEAVQHEADTQPILHGWWWQRWNSENTSTPYTQSYCS